MRLTLFNDILLFLHVGSASGVLPVRGALVLANFDLPRPLRRKGWFRPRFQKTSSPAPSHPKLDGQGKIPSPALVKRQAVTGLAAGARLAEDGAAHHLPLAFSGGC